LILTDKFHSFYVKESEVGVGNLGKAESGVEVGKFGKVGVGVGYFTSDSATLVKTIFKYSFQSCFFGKRSVYLNTMPEIKAPRRGATQ